MRTSAKVATVVVLAGLALWRCNNNPDKTDAVTANISTLPPGCLPFLYLAGEYLQLLVCKRHRNGKTD